MVAIDEPAEQALPTPATSEALWYKDAIIYQLHVRAFRDSNGDGIGDFPGLTQNLDYLQDLGVTALWLLPFYPSPLKDDGYDIANYVNVNPQYGTLGDFKALLRAAHDRGLRVITELVLNHTSDQHAWFQRARHDEPNSRWRNFYVWSDTPNKYPDARIIFKDFEKSNWTWDSDANAYFWHRFYAHQPDLNFDNPEVHAALLYVIDFWLKMGVDGLRLDAVPYLYEREGTTCENLPETHAFLKKLRKHVDEKFSNRMLLAEANQWPDDAIAYFGQEDECHTAFHFPLMPRLFMALQMEDRFPVVDIVEQTPLIADSCQWVVFLRNHDELTLEMVTDEERDYMYRVYAHDQRARINLGIRRRLAPLVGNNRRKIELLNGLLFSLPGTPVIYYGDEIGMGDNIYLGDRNGVRTPMQWCADRNAGFSRANPQQLYLPPIIDFEYHYEVVNVETQHNNPQSLWWWTKRLMAQRQMHKAFSRGTLEMLKPKNNKVLAFVRSYEDERVLVVANLSRFTQYVELDLSAFDGWTPVELFGQTRFPTIRKSHYALTPSPHAFNWFVLEPPHPEKVIAKTTALTLAPLRITAADPWESLWAGTARAQFERALCSVLSARPGFSDKSRVIQGVQLTNLVPVGGHDRDAAGCLALLQVEYVEGESETYALPLAVTSGDSATKLAHDAPQNVIARLTFSDREGKGVLFDATYNAAFCQGLLEAMSRRRRLRGTVGEVVGWSTPNVRRLCDEGAQPMPVTNVARHNSNSFVAFDERLLLKLFRRIGSGINPDLEVRRFLGERDRFTHIPLAAGALEYSDAGGNRATLGVLETFVPLEATAWNYFRDMLSRFFENASAQPAAQHETPETVAVTSVLDLATTAWPARFEELAHEFQAPVELLGRRTAEMHAALASDALDPNFAPQPFTPYDQRSLYQSLRRMTVKTLQLLKEKIDALPESARADAHELLGRESALLDSLRALLGPKMQALQMRVHGDFHLEHVLYTGKDFVIVDFEGEPGKTVSERRLKRLPLVDVACMIRSFHYAVAGALARHLEAVATSAENVAVIERAGRDWFQGTTAVFLKSYLAAAAGQSFLPASHDTLQILLHMLLLRRSMMELNSELTNRVDWSPVPLRGLLKLLAMSPSGGPTA